MTESTKLSTPPTQKITRANVDAQLLQRLGAKVAIVRSLHRSVGIVALGVWHNVVSRHAQDAPKELANLVLCHLVLARKLQDLGEAALVGSFDVLDSKICQLLEDALCRLIALFQLTLTDTADVFSAGWVSQRPVIHLDGRLLSLRLPH